MFSVDRIRRRKHASNENKSVLQFSAIQKHFVLSRCALFVLNIRLQLWHRKYSGLNEYIKRKKFPPTGHSSLLFNHT